MNNRLFIAAFKCFRANTRHGILLPLLLGTTVANAQVGNLLWEENFDNLDPEIWSVDEGNGCEIGLCGWGNQELEYYSSNNVFIDAVPGEGGNNAVVFEVREEPATDTFGNNYSFTSGKIHSENGVSVQYGMIETRVRVPDLQDGLWPAFWMLGTTTAGWPRKGELDIMEMGHSDSGIDSHQHPGTPQNNFVGANAIFYADAACVVGNETCAASTAYQTDNAYVSDTPMNDRFMIYRMYWTDTEIRFTAIDNGVEYDMYDNPIPITEESAELAEPFYFLSNLAVGGTFTGLLNVGDISAPTPSKMYVDYIRVYEYDGLGEVTLGNTSSPEYGTFGVFTDLSSTNNQLEPGINSDIYVWNTASIVEGSEPSFEGENVIAWQYNNPGQWFGGGVQSQQPLDLSAFIDDGELTFRIKIPANVSFRIGITDTFTNQNWVEFPANTTAYGLVRDGEWGQARIPVSELQGGFLALQSTEYPFAITSIDGALPTNEFQMAIDDVLWEGGEDEPLVASTSFGIFTDLSNTNDQLEPGTNSDIYVWNTASIVEGNESSFEGENVIAWQYNNPGQWFGGGVQSRQPLDLSTFIDDGELTFRIKIPANVSFRIGITDAFTNQNWVEFPANTTAYGLVRNGEWGQARIPVVDLQGGFIALQSTEYPFAITSIDGALPTNDFQMAIDDILWVGGEGELLGTPTVAPIPLPAETNLALNRSTSQSSTSHNGASARAVDGNTSGTWSNRSITHTANENQPWWEVDLGSVQGISHLNIFNRTDSCCVSRLSDFYVLVSDSAFTSREGILDDSLSQTGVSNYFFSGTVDGSTEVDINRTGRYVRIQLTGTNPLSLAEVQVIEGEDRSTISVVERATVSVEAEDYAAYSDSSPGNNGGVFREDDVDLQATIDVGGGYNVGWITPGESLTYSVFLQAGSYDVQARVASFPGDGEYALSVEGASLGSSLVASTGGWQIWSSVAAGAVIIPQEGTYTVQIDINSGSFNLNRFDFIPVDSAASATVAPLPGTVTPPNSGETPTPVVTPTPTPIITPIPVITPVPVITPTPNPDPGQPDSDGDGIFDEFDDCPLTPAGAIVDSSGCPLVVGGDVTPLFDSSTDLETAVKFDRGDALVTRIADRGRDRHAREDQFQAYDHYLTFYWENRTATIEIVDYVAKGGDTIEMTMVTQFPLESRDNRWWYYGKNTVAEYQDNSGMTQIGTNTYFKSGTRNHREGREIRIGDKLEFEPSQFLQAAILPRGRDNYYGTTYLYIVGEGLVPWDTENTGFVQGGPIHQEDSFAIPLRARMGGETTLPYNHTNEPDNHFMQLSTNLNSINGQAFVRGRRVHHSSFVDGVHDENAENGVFEDTVGQAGAHYVNESCAGCHVRNGRAEVAEDGENLDKWVFKIGDATGQPDANRGRVLQPNNTGINTDQGEGTVSIASWTELESGLRTPNYSFSSGEPERFSGRIAPNIYGVGLLEGVAEEDILSREDENDSDGDGISGRASRVTDPVTGDVRLGRFGYKAGAYSVANQVARALNTDMGVMSSMLPEPDCGSEQDVCGDSGSEISQDNFDDLSKYISLLGVRPQRNYDDLDVLSGQELFEDVGCTSCHVPTLETSQFTVFSELRSQTIHPYTDMLLHDMGEGLADNLGEGNATGSEWRTAPLWGVGLSACVTGGVINPVGGQGNEVCNPSANFLHDGRARTIDEAIRWHGGEGQAANDAYQALSDGDQGDLVRFVESL